MTERRLTQQGVEVDAADTTPARRLTQQGIEVDAADTTPEVRVTQMGIQVSAEEWWHGWGINAFAGDD